MKTPEKFTEEYSELIKSTLGQHEIQFRKVGLLGTLMNILGNTHYDSKLYYDHLFKEAFIRTARGDHSLKLHASIYGYFPDFANYARAEGLFIFDYDKLNVMPKNILKREVYFKNLVFEVNGRPFSTNASYHFIQENEDYYCLVYSGNDIITIPSYSSKIVVPFHDVYQLENEIREVTIGNYPVGSFFPYVLKLKSGYLVEVRVRIADRGQSYNPENEFHSYGDEYEVRFIKRTEGKYDKVVFLKNTGMNSYVVEFGSGERGEHVPKKSAVLLISKTFGSSGNINIESTPKPKSAVSGIKLYLDDGRIHTSSISKEYLDIEFSFSEGGSDPPSGDELRESIIEYIRTRDNLICKDDFYNIGKKYMNDFRFSLRKGIVYENTFYLYRCFRNQYQNIAPATNITHQLVCEEKPEELTFIWDNNDINVVDNDGNYCCLPPDPTSMVVHTNDDFPVIDNDGGYIYTMFSRQREYLYPSDIYRTFGEPMYGGELSEGRYLYIVKASDNFREVEVGYPVEVTIDGINQNAVKLYWDQIPGAEKYIIYGRPDQNGHFRYWVVFDNKFIDTGKDGETYYDVESVEKMIFYPEYKIHNRTFVSPFVYEYDNYMDWYKGYILYNNLMVYFTSTTSYVEDIEMPIIFFNVKYDMVEFRTIIQIKSYQDISQYIFNLTINGTNISNYRITNRIDNNTWIFVYTDSKYGIIMDKFSFELDVHYDNKRIMKGQTNYVKQIIDLSDQLKLFKYMNITDGLSYITNIPVIDKELFNDDPEYYTFKMFEFVYVNNFKENRMIGDEIQFRFLNTHFINFYHLQFMTKQHYSFDLLLPLKMNVEILIDEDEIDDTFDTNMEKNNIVLELAKELQVNFTGTDIEYYDSKIIDFIHNNRSFVKNVNVQVSDSNNNILNRGIETRDEDEIMKLIAMDESTYLGDRKLRILKYTPPMFYWDIDNIDVIMLYN